MEDKGKTYQLDFKQKMDDVIDSLMKTKGVRSVIFSAKSKDGIYEYQNTAGKLCENSDISDTKTPFWIASITKLFIAVVILKLNEKGKISLDEKACKYLPEDMLKGVHVIKGTDYSEKITVRHLLTHSSGIPDYLEIKGSDGKTLIDRVIEEDDISWSIKDALKIVSDANKPLFEPQNLKNKKYKIRYSDTNFQILIAIIENVTKSPVENVYKEMIFEPLNLENTYLPGEENSKKDCPEATVWAENIPLLAKPKAFRSFGDLCSTLDDLTNFMIALSDGELFEKKETFEEMICTRNNFGFSLSPISPGWPIQYSMGMMFFKLPGIFSGFKDLPEVMGHTGATGSWLFYCPKREMVFAGCVNQLTAAAVPFRIITKML